MRARNIKPGFFRNEELVEVTPGSRLLFIGLWCMADRKGLLEDRPKKIKLEIMPYDDVDCEKMLQELYLHNLILRYNVNGKNYISIPNFAKHQKPHPNEKSSQIPPPSKADKVKKTSNQGSKHFEPRITPLSPDIINDKYLNPDIRNPDTLNEDIRNPDNSSKGGKPPPECPQKEIIGLYHKILPEMPEVRVWNDTQESWLRARWREDPERQSLAWWEKYFTWIRESDFLMGRTKNEFSCDLEWLIRKMNFAKIANGRYHRKKQDRDSGIDEWLRLSKEKVKREKEAEYGQGK